MSISSNSNLPNCILFDDTSWKNLLPLTYTKPVSAIRCGIMTIKEKWEHWLGVNCSDLTRDYLQKKFPVIKEEDNLLINGSCMPDDAIVEMIFKLQTGQVITADNMIVAARIGKTGLDAFDPGMLKDHKPVELGYKPLYIRYLWDIFNLNGEAITADFKSLTKNRTSRPLSDTNRVIEAENIFIEEGATIEFANINAGRGPVYIGRDAEVMEGCNIRGPFVMCDHSVLKMDAKIYGPTTIGPSCKAGGEINNAVISGYSNKAHDGFLGNSVMGEWCNIGADTNTSNLRNDYGKVKLWNYKDERFVDTGLQFCGLIMGDHSKCGINTMFNTGTVVGVNANVYDTSFVRNFIPSFSWGGNHGFKTYKLSKAFQVVERVMERRKMVFNDIEQDILSHVFEITKKYRKFGD